MPYGLKYLFRIAIAGFLTRNEAGQRGREELAVFLYPERDRAADVEAAVAGAERDGWRNGVRLEALANLAHELRTPVQVFLGYLEILREDGVDAATAHQIVERLRVNVIDLARMVENVMEFAVADAAALPVDAEPVSLAQIADEVAPALEAANQRKHLALEVEVDEPAAVICVDRRAVRAIVENLVVNAIKFTDHGSVKLALRRWMVPMGGPKLVIEVTDSGPGIEPALLKRAFEPAVQLSHTSTRRFRGMGLGLAVVKRNVEALDADLEVNSTCNCGSTFAVRIPLKAAPEVCADAPRHEHGH
jgi:signal transduction histidine kinase